MKLIENTWLVNWIEKSECSVAAADHGITYLNDTAPDQGVRAHDDQAFHVPATPIVLVVSREGKGSGGRDEGFQVS